jgi:citrate synthase
LGLPRGAALALFALGRTAGWLAHALEQYQLGQMIRPRAKYVGPVPAA